MDTTIQVARRDDLLILPDIATPEDRALEKKRIRRHLILNAIRESGPLSRADITRHLGFNSQTVKTMVTELVQEGLVIEKEEDRVSGMGRPPTPCRLNPEAAMVCGVAVDGNHAGMVLMDLEGRILYKAEEETPDFSSPIAEAGWVKDFTIRKLNEGGKSMPPLCGIAVGVPGTIESEVPGPFGVLTPSARSTAGVIQRAILRDARLPVLSNSQHRMNAIGSIWFGSSKRYNQFVYIDLSSVPRIVVVRNGRLNQGHLGLAGEMWQMPIPGMSDPSNPEKKTRLHSILSQQTVLADAAAKKLEVENYSDFISLVEKGDSDATAIMDKFAMNLTDAIAMIICLYNPEAVVLGGEMALRGSDQLDLRLRHFLEFALPTEVLMRTEVDFASSETQDAAVCAGTYVLQHIFIPTHFDLIELL